jgi:hypothetical protein
MKGKDELVTRVNALKNIVKLSVTIVGNALHLMLFISVYKIRKNATFIKKRII